MAAVLHHKLVSSLPGVLQANSVYYVRTGAGFDTYVTNDLGIVVAYPLNLPPPATTTVLEIDGGDFSTTADEYGLEFDFGGFT